MGIIESILFTFLISAQWHQFPGPYLGHITDIEIIDPAAETIFVTTSNSMSGGVFISTDGGQSWRSSSNGISDDIGYGMNQITVCPLNHNLLICATAFFGPNYVFRSTDQGQNWTLLSYDLGPVGDLKFFPGSKDSVLSISYGCICKSTDGGINWDLKSSGLHVGSALWFKHNSPDTIFAGTYDSLMVSTNQGETWIATPFKKPAYDIAADPDAPETLYIASLTQGVYKVWNNGHDYALLGLNVGRYNTSINFDQTSHKLYVAGYMWNGRVCVSSDHGQSWYEYRTDQIPDDRINDIEIPIANANKIFGAGTDAGVMILESPDSIWVLSSEGINEAAIRSIAVAPTDPNVIYVAMSCAGVWTSKDGGNTWASSPSSPTWRKFHETEYWPPGLAVSPNDPNICFATYYEKNPVTHELCRAVLKTTDGGATWEENGSGLDATPPDCDVKWIACHPWTDDTLLVATTYGAFKSVDEGITWQKICDYYLYYIAFDPIDPKRIYATSGGMFYYSEDGGTTWKDNSTGLSLQSDVMMVDVDPANNNTVYAALCGLEQSDPLSGIYISEDYGLTWTEKNNGLPEIIRRGRVMVDPINSYVWATTPLLGAGQPGVYYTSDGGSSWLPGDQGLNTNRTTFLEHGVYPMLGTQGNGIWYWADLAVHEETKPRLSISSVYPNPCRGRINIDYNLSSKRHVKMRIVDVAGRVIENLFDDVVEAGNHNASLPVDLPAGVYFVHMLSDEFNTSQRFVVIH